MSLNRVSGALLLAATAIVGALSMTACGANTEARGGEKTGFIIGSDGISRVAKSERQTPNALKGETLQDDHLDVSDLKGKVVVLNVWGSWCSPCRAEAPNFARVAKETADKGVEFVGINTRDVNRQSAVKFEEDYHVPYPSIYDPTGKVVLYGFPRGSLNPQTVPSTIVLDKEGRIAARALQPLNEDELHSMITPLLSEA
ncbi:TlpA family protein disulfide reductase [Streptomyces albidoflavus]